MTLMITREMAIKVRDVVDKGLVSGLGTPEPGKFCVEAAVCYALNLPHGDDPGCVSEPLRQLKIRLNDAAWSSNITRANGLRRLAIAQLGTRGVLDDKEFVRRVVDVTIRKTVPAVLRAAARVNPTHEDALEAAAMRCEQEGTQAACEHARHVARTAASSAAAALGVAAAASSAAAALGVAAAAASSAANAAYANAVTYAANAWADAAYANANAWTDAAYANAVTYAANAWTDAAYADAAADANAARDKSLAEYAEWIVDILIAMKAPGCKYLDLVPKAGAA